MRQTSGINEASFKKEKKETVVRIPSWRRIRPITSGFLPHDKTNTRKTEGIFGGAK
jgi:hypothetical protein